MVLMGIGCRFTPGSPPGAVVRDASQDGALTDAAADAADARSIDAPPDARVCPSAPAGCTTFTCATSSSCFYVCATKRTWTSAATACMSSAIGCIATIHGQAEQDCITAAAAPVFPDFVWFGWVQTSGSVEPGGGWHWQCGTSTYVAPNWGNGEPNNQGGNEDCGGLTTGGGWFDGNCTSQARYVCELP